MREGKTTKVNVDEEIKRLEKKDKRRRRSRSRSEEEANPT